MPESTVITRYDELSFSLAEVPTMPLPKEALMVTPEYFTIDYVINPHMEGHVGSVDRDAARQEWEQVRDAFVQAGIKIHAIQGQAGLPDMVFCANQSLPYISENGSKHVLMSRMHADQRKDEVGFIQQWYQANAYTVHHIESDTVRDFEGMGDAIWHSGKRLIWGGYGFRSSLDAYTQVSALFDVPVVALELRHPSFYHLDTCFCMLNSKTALIYPHAFTDEGLDLIRAVIPVIVEADQYEAEALFACNATCPDGQHVIIQQGCTKVNRQLYELGFTVLEVSTDEYRKSGGSVFCMKMMVF
ncbi:MAG: N-Dimethylarginine dimethylaminohydrolase [Bacteroidetes bacterium HLUCCA01]|nr:MAG: N-Dimethylarginine dimethylaminohydrolase [Bacteroidetes bacterium HLUCCA01]